MPRVLIAGCGYVGQATADLFVQAGWAVEGWTASTDSAAALKSKPYCVRAVDITRPARVAEHAVEADVIIHCASSGGGGPDAYRRVYLEGARNLRATFPDAAFLFTSSTSVYAQHAGEWVDELSSAEPAHERGRILRETEELVLATRGTVARLAGLIGPGRSALLRKFLAGEAVRDGECDRFLNHVHRDDSASALFHLITRVNADPDNIRDIAIYNVADTSPILQSAVYEWLARRFDRPLPPVGRSSLGRKRGTSNKRVSSAKLRATGWQPRFPTFENAMLESILPQLDSSGA